MGALPPDSTSMLVAMFIGLALRNRDDIVASRSVLLLVELSRSSFGIDWRRRIPSSQKASVAATTTTTSSVLIEKSAKSKENANLENQAFLVQRTSI